MNYEIILIITFSYLLGIFTMWVKDRCDVPKEENLPVCHFHPANKESDKD